jgi:hypothetical protein
LAVLLAESTQHGLVTPLDKVKDLKLQGAADERDEDGPVDCIQPVRK